MKRLLRKHHHWTVPLLLAILLIVYGLFLETKVQLSSAGTQTTDTPFMIVALPDTQHYSNYHPDTYTAQTKWIADNYKKQNIIFVTHEGDIVDIWYSDEQWQNASRSMATLDPIIPYGIAPGNHDQAPDGQAFNFEKYFPMSRVGKTAPAPFDFLSTQTNSFGSFDKRNTYWLLNTGERKLLALNLDFCATDETLAWADGVLDRHRDRTAIITTHSFIDSFGKREPGGRSCEVYNTKGKNTAEDMWQKLIVKPQHDNVLLILSGHDIWNAHGAARRTDYVNGKPVYQLLADYQELGYGGAGYMRLMTFDYTNKKIDVKTYSPLTNTYLRDPNNQFELPLDSR